MSLLLQNLSIRSHSPQSVLKYLAARLFATESINPNSFPNRPTCSNYDDQINQYARSGDFEAVRRLLNKRIADGRYNTSNTFRFLANTDSYASLLEELRSTLARLDVGFPRKHAYDTIVARLCKLERVDDALDVLIHDMAPRGRNPWGPTTTTFHPILSALTRKKRMKEAWNVVDVMRSNDISPDVTSYNYFLTSYCVVGEIGEAIKVMKKMEEEGVSPDSRTHDALVLGLCRSGKMEGAIRVLTKMEEDGVPILYSTHAHIINELVKKGYHAQAVKFVTAYGGRDEKLDAETFGNLASKLIKLNRPEAELVVKEMVQLGLRLNHRLRDYYETCMTNVEENVSLD